MDAGGVSVVGSQCVCGAEVCGPVRRGHELVRLGLCARHTRLAPRCGAQHVVTCACTVACARLALALCGPQLRLVCVAQLRNGRRVVGRRSTQRLVAPPHLRLVPLHKPTPRLIQPHNLLLKLRVCGRVGVN